MFWNVPHLAVKISNQEPIAECGGRITRFASLLNVTILELHHFVKGAVIC